MNTCVKQRRQQKNFRKGTPVKRVLKRMRKNTVSLQVHIPVINYVHALSIDSQSLITSTTYDGCLYESQFRGIYSLQTF